MSFAVKESMKLYRNIYVAIYMKHSDHEEADKQATIAVENFEATFPDHYEDEEDTEDEE